jgi:hypothetical protein
MAENEHVVGAWIVRTNSWRLGLRGWECYPKGHKQLPSSRTCRQCEWDKLEETTDISKSGTTEQPAQVSVYEASSVTS